MSSILCRSVHLDHTCAQRMLNLLRQQTEQSISLGQLTQLSILAHSFSRILFALYNARAGFLSADHISKINAFWLHYLQYY